MDSQKVQIIMETSKYSVGLAELVQVTTCWCQQMWSVLHHACELVWFEFQTTCKHFCNGKACVKDESCPSVHNLFPLVETFRNDLWNVQTLEFCSLWTFADWPEKSPLGVSTGDWCWLVLLVQACNDLRIITWHFGKFG